MFVDKTVCETACSEDQSSQTAHTYTMVIFLGTDCTGNRNGSINAYEVFSHVRPS